MKPFVLADDLSGAVEAGAAFHHAGWWVTLPLREDGGEQAEGELRVISTETRNAAASAAAAAVRSALRRSLAADGQLVFKKIDSTLRGPLGAELSAVIDELAPSIVLLCPAHPKAGRVVRNGALLVDGVALEESEFRFDPVWPASTGNLTALLAAQGVMATCTLSRDALWGAVHPFDEIAEREARQGCTVVIADAESPADLERIGALAASAASRVVLVGSGALAAVVADTRRTRNPAPAPMTHASRALVVCGSRHDVSRRQLDFLARERRATVIDVFIDHEAAAIAREVTRALQANPVVGLRLMPGTAPVVPAGLVQQLANVAAGVLRACSIDLLYLTGGETARAVLQVAAVARLEILTGLEGGAVACRPIGPPWHDVVVVTKPGGFGADESMAQQLSYFMK